DHPFCEAGKNSRRRLRIPDALWHPPRSATRSGEARLADAGLHPLRNRVVPVFHASPRRAPRQRVVPGKESFPVVIPLHHGDTENTEEKLKKCASGFSFGESSPMRRPENQFETYSSKCLSPCAPCLRGKNTCVSAAVVPRLLG